MNSKSKTFLKNFTFILLASFFIISCEDDIREVTIYDKGTADAVASVNSIIEGESVDFTSATTKVQSAEWTFPGGNPATSINPDVTVTYANEGVYEAKLTVKYVDNTTAFRIITITVADNPDTNPEPDPCGGTPQTYNIALATNNITNDAGYIAELEAAGHTVEAIASKYENLSAAGVSELNGFDLVIISRNNNSGAYGTDATVRANWMSVTKPVLIMSPYIARSSRLQLFSTDGGIDSGGTSVTTPLETHPVFTGIELTAGNTGDITIGTLNTPDTAGAGNGILIGTDGANVAVAEWDANTEFYAGSSTAAGKRMYLAGTGTYTYNEVGTKLFLNVIQYIVSGVVPQPCPVLPYNIALATNNVANEAGYIAALEAAGHTVEAISGKYENLTAAGVAELNGFDIVIITRNNNSGAYGTDATVRANWMAVTKPVLIMSPYVARSSRLQLFSMDGGIDSGGTSVTTTLTSHPVFAGVTLTAGNTGDITTGTLNTPDTAGVGNGVLIGTDGMNAAIAEWNANTAFYAGSSTAAGKRMYFAGTGTYTYNEVGEVIFLNIIQYLGAGN